MLGTESAMALNFRDQHAFGIGLGEGLLLTSALHMSLWPSSCCLAPDDFLITPRLVRLKGRVRSRPFLWSGIARAAKRLKMGLKSLRGNWVVGKAAFGAEMFFGV